MRQSQKGDRGRKETEEWYKIQKKLFSQTGKTCACTTKSLSPYVSTYYCSCTFLLAFKILCFNFKCNNRHDRFLHNRVHRALKCQSYCTYRDSYQVHYHPHHISVMLYEKCYVSCCKPVIGGNEKRNYQVQLLTEKLSVNLKLAIILMNQYLKTDNQISHRA